MSTNIHIPIRVSADSCIGEFPRHGLVLKVMDEAGLDLDDSVVEAVLSDISPQLNQLELMIERLAFEHTKGFLQDAMDYQSMVNDVRSIR